MADGDQQTQQLTRGHARRRALRAALGAGALAVPIPLSVQGIDSNATVPAESAIAAGVVHDAPSAQAVYAADVMIMVNHERTAKGCPALAVSPAVTQAALEHSQDMGEHGYFGHDTPAGVTPWTRMEQAGYAEPAAENIGKGYLTPQQVVDGWMSDPAHRGNILNCAFKSGGVGYYSGTTQNGTAATDDGPWWTADFGYE
jgi:uncharacterized protein YkwD